MDPLGEVISAPCKTGSFDHNHYTEAKELTKELTRLGVTQAPESSLWALVEAGTTHSRYKPKK